MRAVRHCQQGLVIGLTVLGMLAGPSRAIAQDRAKVEIVPNVPHAGRVNSAAFSHDGARLLSGSSDKTLKLWDTASGQLIRTFEGHADVVNSVAFSPDSMRVLSGSDDTTLKLWDATTGQVIRTYEGHSGKVTSVAFSPDGTRLLSGSGDSTFRLWDIAMGQAVRTVEAHSGPISSVSFSPDGAHVVSGSFDKTLKLWNAATGQLVRTFEGHSREVTSVAFSTDGMRLVSGSVDKAVNLWDAATGQLVRKFVGHSGEVISVALSLDGALLLSGSSDLTLKLWNAASGRLLRTLSGHRDAVSKVAFSQDGVHILSSSLDWTIRLWTAKDGNAVRSFGEHASSAVEPVIVSPDGTIVVSAGLDGMVRVWDATTGALRRILRGPGSGIFSVAFSADGAQILAGSHDGAIKLWDAGTGRLMRTFEGHSKNVVRVALSHDGAQMLSASQDGTIRVWDVETGRSVKILEAHTARTFGAAFSTDFNRALITGSQDLSSKEGHTVNLLDLTTGRLLHTLVGHESLISAVEFSHDGTRILTGSWDKSARLWDAGSGQLIRSFVGHSGAVNTVAFSPDNARILTGSHDRAIKLWDAVTGQLLRTFEGHSGIVLSAAFSPDGGSVMSGSTDSTIKFWRRATGELLQTVLGARDGEWLSMTPKGFFIASRAGTEMLGVVRGLDAYSIMQFYDHLHRPDLVEEMLKDDPESKHKDAARRINLERVLDSGPAPRIELLADRTEKRGETVKLAARIIDEGGGIGTKVIWRVNGKTQGATTTPGLGGPVSPGRYVAMQQTLTVDPTTKNEVEIIAYNGKGLLATPPLRFTIDAWGVATQERPRLFVLAVGVDKYARTDWQLRYAAKDADAFAAALKTVGSPLFGEPMVTTLLDAEVTEARIAAEFERLSSIVKARDVFVLFLGGHGRSIAGEGWFYLPQDLRLDKGHSIEKNGIGQDKWQKWMAKIPAQKSLTILDACESGANEAFRGGDRERETVIAQLEYATGRNIIAAAPAGKAAYEGYQGHGVLTYALLEGLHRQEGGGADTVDVFGLAAHVSRQVPIISQREFGIRQQPRFTPTGDNFPIGVRAPVSRAAIETKPAAVLRAVSVRAHPAEDSRVVDTLARGIQVRIKRVEGPWSLIERSEKEIGYVPSEALLELERN